MDNNPLERPETESEVSKPEVDQTTETVKEEESESSDGRPYEHSDDGKGNVVSEGGKTTSSDDTKSSTELTKASEERLKDVERDVYEMLRNEEMIYVSKTRKIVQFILFMILILVGGFLVLLSRGLLFATMASDATTRQLAGHGLNVNGK